MSAFLSFFNPASANKQSGFLVTASILITAYLLSACMHPPTTNTQTNPAPNVAIVDASVPSQPVANTPTDTGTPIVTSAATPQGLLLQAGTFSVRSNADTVAATIRNTLPQYAHLVQVHARHSNWRVLIGGFASEHERTNAAQAIRNLTSYEVVNAAP